LSVVIDYDDAGPTRLPHGFEDIYGAHDVSCIGLRRAHRYERRTKGWAAKWKTKSGLDASTTLAELGKITHIA
jgi:hypothetical protein